VTAFFPEAFRKARKGMEARLNRTAGRCQKVVFLRVAGHFALLAALLPVLMGARQRSVNFIVETPDPNFAQQVSQAAEKYRHQLAVDWLGQAMPNWSQPCVMTVQVGPHLGAGGATTFMFDRGEVFGWRMSIQGPAERILDSVLPHEITHMIYASYFRQPLPRWADEGGATSVEHASEKNKHRNMLIEFLHTGRGIAFSRMFAMSDYPRDIMPLYAQGYSLAEFLIQTGGRRKYVEFLGDGLQGDDWSGAIQRHYGVKDLGTLQNTWLAWVQQGSPPLRPREAQPPLAGELVAANERRPRPEPNLIYRVRDKQSPATPLASLVPVNINSPRPLGEGQGVRAMANVTPARATAAAIKWVNPVRTTSAPAIRIAVADPRNSAGPQAGATSSPTMLSASGWRIAGASASAATASPSTPLSNEPLPTQVTHPQPVEQPRQTVLR
jgi:hypothetical protein